MYNIIRETNRQPRFDAGYRKLGAGALEWPRGMLWGGRWEGGSGWGTCVHPWQMHVDVWQNQYNIVKLKKKKTTIRWGLFSIIVLECCFISSWKLAIDGTSLKMAESWEKLKIFCIIFISVLFSVIQNKTLFYEQWATISLVLYSYILYLPKALFKFFLRS